MFARIDNFNELDKQNVQPFLFILLLIPLQI